jgi:CTP synthase
MQVIELAQDVHPYFIAGQFHPELTSRPLHPQPMFMGLIAAAVARANPGLNRDQISTRWLRPSISTNPHIETVTRTPVRTA